MESQKPLQQVPDCLPANVMAKIPRNCLCPAIYPLRFSAAARWAATFAVVTGFLATPSILGAPAAGPKIDTSPDRAKTTLNPGLKRIGTIRPRSANEIEGSNWTLGCETLDRDFADYQQYKEYLVLANDIKKKSIITSCNKQ